MIGGVPGAGKSGLLTALLAALDGQAHARCYGIDLKGGVDLGPWRRAGTLTDLATTPTEAVGLLRDLATEHRCRRDLLVRTGENKVSDLGVSPDLPLLVLVIDEAADLFTSLSGDREDKALANEATTLVATLVRQGRATGISTVLATQKPTTDAIPSAIRDNATAKVALRCTTPEQARAILGDLAGTAEGTPPTLIPASTPGVAIATASTGTLIRARAYDARAAVPRASAPGASEPRASIPRQRHVETVHRCLFGDDFGFGVDPAGDGQPRGR